MFYWWRKRRRQRVAAGEFPELWRAMLARRVPYVTSLTGAERRELEGHILVFLAEKRFEGVDGVVVTDEMRVIIAAQACILLLGRETDYFPDLISILIYPHKYDVEVASRNPDGTVTEHVQTRLGESWHRGEVVLSWDDVKQGAAHPHDGLNVVFHEFAHQLDGEAGDMDGTPHLPRLADYAVWGRVFTEAYEALLADLEYGRRPVINAYGATNEAEFFAVAVETFFERPRRLRRGYPEVYDLLKYYFRQDPAARRDNEEG